MELSVRAKLLLDKHMNNSATPAERTELIAYIDDHPEADWNAHLAPLFMASPADTTLSTEKWDPILKSIYQSNPQNTQPASITHRVHFLRKWGWAAACVFIVCSTLFVLYQSQLFTSSKKDSISKAMDIAPGREGAILTLADGTQVVLDTAGNGLIANQNGTKVILMDGQLSYDASAKNTDVVDYNIMTTPKGRQFQIRLPDGTIVWLNAGSSLKFPTLFTGTERRVEITGEAYFKIAGNANKPFRVKVTGMNDIEVLGTEFNVSAYSDGEIMKTTLVEGSVKIADVILKPGEQASIVPGKGVVSKIEKGDLERAIAWKNVYFNFEGVSVISAMKQLERWYDIEIAVDKDIPDIEFYGELSRRLNLGEMLIALQGAGVHFQMESGRRLTVIP